MIDQTYHGGDDESRSGLMKSAGADQTYPPLDYLTLTDESFLTVSMLAIDYHQTKNITYAIIAFCEYVAAKHSPPAWVLDALCDGFKKHRSNPDPDLLASQLGVAATGSGKNNPYKSAKTDASRHLAMGDMYKVLSFFHVSKTSAAKAVIAKYKLQLRPKSVVSFYNDWLKKMPVAGRPTMDFNSAEHQQFVQSFPVIGRKHLKK